MRVSLLGVKSVQPDEEDPGRTFSETFREWITVEFEASRTWTVDAWTPTDSEAVAGSSIDTDRSTASPAASWPELGAMVTHASAAEACQSRDTFPVFVSV